MVQDRNLFMYRDKLNDSITFYQNYPISMIFRGEKEWFCTSLYPKPIHLQENETLLKLGNQEKIHTISKLFIFEVYKN